MDREAVSCTEIQAAGYDEASQVLEIEFCNGEVIRFEGTPKYLYLGLISAQSPAKFYRSLIADANYPSEVIYRSDSSQ